jgi:hypothetical protein
MSGDSSLGIGIGLALKSYGRAFTYVKTDRVLDLGNLAPFTIPDLSGNANTATLYSGIYVSTNGTTDKAIGANATALGSGNYYLTGKIKPAGTTAKTTMDGSTASNLTGLTAGVWQDFQTATASAITPSSINLGWDGTAFNATVDNWSDVKLHDASDDSVVAHWKLYDSADASLGGYPALDCVGGFHGAHVGCAGGSAEATILQTAGEDFNIGYWYDGANYLKSGSNAVQTGDFTFEATHVYKTNTGTRGIAGSGWLSPSNGFGFFIQGTTNYLGCQVRNGANVINIISSLAPADGAVYRLKMVWVESTHTLKFYINDALIGSDADVLVTRSSNPDDVWSIGARSDGGTVQFFNTGMISSVKLDGVNILTLDTFTATGSPSLYHVAESETTAGQDALGNAIENPRPNDRVLNLTTGTGYAEIADSASLDLTTAATWEIWGNFYGDKGMGEIFLSRDVSGAVDRCWNINRGAGNADNRINIGVVNSTNNGTSAFQSTNLSDKVQQVVFTYSSGTLKIYVDSVEGTLTQYFGTTITSTLPNRDYPVLVGAFNAPALSSFVERQIGDIRIYDRVLTADEVLKNYQARKSAYGL